ncbi:MAG: ribosome biogenesis GTPase Der [bacterium]|nr:ribosome biogenesis GTPase Der [bacterium]
MTIVAIIGRPNTGKSTLFNAMIGKRAAIVHDTPNLTRDRHYGEYTYLERKYLLIDTGGIEKENNTPFIKLVEEQADIAINESDVILFVFDNRQELTSDDLYIAKKLRSSKEKVIIVANKCDAGDNNLNEEIYGLGFQSIVKVSAEHRLNINELKDIIADKPSKSSDSSANDGIRFAVIGKPNTGKSSIINALLDEDRMIVSDIPGTTRDAVDSYLEYEQRKVILIDTAGIRRAAKIEEPSEYYTILRSKLAVRRSDVVVLVMDIMDKVTFQDKRILDEALDFYKPTVLVFNKTDKITDTEKTRVYKEVIEKLDFESYLPKMFVSAKEKKHMTKIIELGLKLKDYLPKHFRKHDLNTLLFEIVSEHKHPVIKKTRPRFFTLEQVSDEPIRFLIRSSMADSIDSNYKRYIINSLRERLKIGGLPFELNFKERRK